MIEQKILQESIDISKKIVRYIDKVENLLKLPDCNKKFFLFVHYMQQINTLELKLNIKTHELEGIRY